LSVTRQELVSGLAALRLVSHVPVIAHVEMHVFGGIAGGAETFLQVLMSQVDTLMMPVFTYRTMVIPAAGPENNGMRYNRSHGSYSHAELFDPHMPADAEMGEVAELLRRQPEVSRSEHPVLSFASTGINAALRVQGLDDPLRPVRVLAELEGMVLLAGVDHTRNISLHLAEQMAGRRTFTRWALTRDRIVELTTMPGCAQGFDQVSSALEAISRKVKVGNAFLTAIPLRPMLRIAYEMIRNDPLALLCGNPDCLLCASVRSSHSDV